MHSFFANQRALFTALIVSSLMAGCAMSHTSTTLPEPARYAPAEVNQPFVPHGEPVNPEYVMSFTLEQLLVYADNHSPVIRIAQARVGLAGADIVDAEILFPTNPQLDFGAGVRTIDDATGFKFEVAVQQQFEIAGEPGLRLEAAQDQQRLAIAAVNEIRWSVHVEVHRLFVGLLLVRERMAQAESFVAFSQAMRDTAARQVEAGESSPLILLVADADLAQTRETVISVRQAHRALQAHLEGVIGWPLSYFPPVEGVLPDIRSAPVEEELLRMMAENHPSLRTRELAVVASRGRFLLEERESWPEPTLGFSYGRQSALASEAEVGVWLFNLSLPILMWRTNQGDRARAEADLQVADLEREASVIQLRSDLLLAASALNAAVERVSLYETGIVPQLEQNLALLQRAYELGEVDVHEISQTRERLLNATGRHIDARIAYYETAVALEGFVGTEIWYEYYTFDVGIEDAP
jgi:cobalt-zinc-cadmium efflux system outer membrane protein